MRKSAHESNRLWPSLFQLKKNLFSLRVWTVPLVLVIVACGHMRQWKTQQRSSWGAGAGFGMFATVDYHGTRFIHVHAVRGNHRQRVDIPAELAQTVGLKARALPTAQNLERFCQALWEHLQTQASGANEFAGHDATGLSVEMWGMTIDATRRCLTRHRIRQMYYSPSQHRPGASHEPNR